MRFPLQPDQLPQLRVDAQTLQSWQLDAQQNIQEVLLNRQSWYYQFPQVQTQFKQVYDKHGVLGFSRKAVDSYAKASTIETLCRAEMQISLDDVAYGLYCEDTTSQRIAMAQLYQEMCLDAAVLQVSERQTAEDPCRFSGVKWLAFTSPAKQIVALRDYIYFEHICTTQDADGRSVVVSFVKSHPLEPDQVVEPALSTTRGSTYLFSIYRQEDDGIVLHYQGRNDAAGSMPAWLALAAVPFMFEGVLNTYSLADAKSIIEWGVLEPQRSKSRNDAAAKGCRVCYKRFTVMRMRYSCRTCDHAVCRHCFVTIQLFDSQKTSSSGLPLVRERFCLRCLLFARDQRRKRQSSGDFTRPTFHSEVSSDSFFGDSLRSLRTSSSSSSASSQWSRHPADIPSSRSSVEFIPVVLASGRVRSERSSSSNPTTLIEQNTTFDDDRAHRYDQFTSLYGRIAKQATILRRLRREQQNRHSPKNNATICP